jgi:hypothetical protein
LEHKFQAHLSLIYNYNAGNSAKGIDFPSLGVDIKVTSIEQPQSSSPLKSARQKIFGLGYSLLVFVYKKQDDATTQTATLNILHVIFVEKEQTADFQMTTGIAEILARKITREFWTTLLLSCRIKIFRLTKSKPERLRRTLLNGLPRLAI